MWALAKIKAYQSIKEPFIHVDGDVFIWTKIDESLRDHELIVQNEETTTDYYGKMWRDIRHAISYMPEEMKRYDLHIDNKAYNMGIFGGTDIDFIQRYTYKAFDFVDKKTDNIIYNAYRGVINCFCTHYYMTNHVEWKVKFPANQPKATLPILTKAHQKKLMDYLKDNFTFPNLGILVCLSTGLRIGEVCALKWSDINMDTGLLHVNCTIERIYIVDSDKPHTEIVINTPKTKNSLREIPLSKELVRIFKSLMKVVNKDYYVLTNNTKPTEPRTYRNYFNKLLKQLDIPRLKIHGLRHSFATCCIESHCDYKTVSVLLGLPLERSNVCSNE